MSTETRQKQLIITALVAQEETHILLDARQPGVSVPAAFQGKNALILKFSHRYDTGALQLSDWGITQRLGFGGASFVCRVPWEAVYAAKGKAGGHEWTPPADPPPSSATRRGGLSLVKA